MNGRKKELLSILLVSIIILLILMNSVMFYVRFDFTDDNIYSISELSKAQFEKIEENLFITYYVSSPLKRIAPIPRDIENFLNEYAIQSNRKISVEVVDPEKEEIIDRVIDTGIFPQQIEVIDKDEPIYAEVFSGILVQYKERNEAIPIVYSLEQIEYDLYRAINRVVEDKLDRLGVLIGDHEKSMERDYQLLIQHLSNHFNIIEIQAGDTIPDISSLFVLGGKDLTIADLIPIDSFIQAGGSVFFALGGIFIDIESDLSGKKLTEAPIFNIIEHYGVEINPIIVLDIFSRDFRVPYDYMGKLEWQFIDKYPPWLSIMKKNISENNPITQHFYGLDLLWSSPLQITAKNGYEVLINSSSESWAMADPIITDPYLRHKMEQIESERKKRILGVSLKENFSPYFKDESEEYNVVSKNDASNKSRLVIIGDSDFASDMIQYSDSYPNLIFLTNIAQWLSYDEEVIELRTRAIQNRQIDRLSTENTRIIYHLTLLINIGFIPVIVLGHGAIRIYKRKNKAKSKH